MRLKFVATLCCILLLSLAGLSSAYAQSMVSIKGSMVNWRNGPGLKSEVLWELSHGYPLQVLGSKGNWLNVQDFEGDKGWVSTKMVDQTAHLIVNAPQAKLRAGPGAEHPVVADVPYGEVLRTLQYQSDWVQVQRTGGKPAWIARSLVWGW